MEILGLEVLGRKSKGQRNICFEDYIITGDQRGPCSNTEAEGEVVAPVAPGEAPTKHVEPLWALHSWDTKNTVWVWSYLAPPPPRQLSGVGMRLAQLEASEAGTQVSVML